MNTISLAISYINRLLLEFIEMSVVNVFAAINFELFGSCLTRGVLG
ncbi:hypothetical protein [uncultured Photobacterium sp.]|nr:hypothetical protein [uncultured Photobacterium sp.]